MEKDFHFYVTYALANRAGFIDEDAYTIAYASQYVDDNNESQYPRIDGDPQFPSAISTENGFFRPVMTQSMSVKSMMYEIHKFVYVPFHFLPGDNNRPINGKINKYSTTPDSHNARVLLRKALASGDLYRIGIAVHTFADTWSHQDFSGYEEEWNSVFNWRNPFRAFVPNVGHADVAHLPDVISTTWDDYRFERDSRTKNNKERALEACKRIFQELRRSSNGPLFWSEVKKDFKKIINAHDYDDRVKEVKAYVGKNLTYQEHKWLNDAIKDRKSQYLEAEAHFENTDWYRFQMAARANLVQVMDMLKTY